MADLRATVASGLTVRYEKLAGVLRELAAPFDEEQFWAKLFPFGNSIGHLVLHLTGNLNYYVGAQIAGTGYVRDRPQEFFGCGAALQGRGIKEIRSGDWDGHSYDQ